MSKNYITHNVPVPGINQRLNSGRRLDVEYTTVELWALEDDLPFLWVTYMPVKYHKTDSWTQSACSTLSSANNVTGLHYACFRVICLCQARAALNYTNWVVCTRAYLVLVSPEQRWTLQMWTQLRRCKSLQPDRYTTLATGAWHASSELSLWRASDGASCKCSAVTHSLWTVTREEGIRGDILTLTDFLKPMGQFEPIMSHSQPFFL